MKLGNNEYVQNIAQKLTDAKDDGLFAATMGVRDEAGIMQSFSRILQTAEQYYFEDPNQLRDPAKAMANFSANQSTGSSLGVSGAANLATMDAIDISIAAAVFSLMPYLAIERDMTSSSTNISYQDIIAEFANGDLAAGEAVLGAFQAPNTKLNMALPVKSADFTNEGAAAVGTVMNLGTTIMPESVAATLKNATGTVVATGFDRNGSLFFSGTANLVATVDYKKGTVNVAELPVNYKIEVKANIDTTSDTSGASILTLTSDYKNVLLTATPRQLVFKDSNFKNAYLNKLNVRLAGTNAQVDYGQMAVGKLINIYINYVNLIVVEATIAAGLATGSIEGTYVASDISGYTGANGATGYADTKYDFIKSFIIDLNQKSLDSTGKGLTALLVGARGANKLASTPDFVKSAEFNELNAMIGTYDGIPVVRHQLVNKYEPANNTQAYIFGIFKDPSGTAAPVAFGEFLPVRISDKVANYNNPEQIAQSMTSYCGVVRCVDGLCHLGKLTIAK